MPKAPLPTDAQLAILAVLWRLGPCTVRQVHLELSKTQQTGYTTTLKLMQVMAQRGHCLRDESGRSHVYSTCQQNDEVQRGLLRELVNKAFGGSTAQLVVCALDSEQATSATELAEIQKLVAAHRKGKKR